jgi:hypothetical protein
MIEQLQDMPDGVLGFRFSGEIARKDYDEVLIPGLTAAFERGEVRCLCVLGHDFDGYEAGAVWEDVKTGARFGLGHGSAWKRIALATDVDWIRHMTSLFGWMAPGELKVFPLERLEDAKAWAAG